MKLTKYVADSITRKFRAEMNKAARDGLIHVCHFGLGNKRIVSFELRVGYDLADPFGKATRKK